MKRFKARLVIRYHRRIFLPISNRFRAETKAGSGYGTDVTRNCGSAEGERAEAIVESRLVLMPEQ